MAAEALISALVMVPSVIVPAVPPETALRVASEPNPKEALAVDETKLVAVPVQY